MAVISASAAVIVQYPDAEQWPCHASKQMTMNFSPVDPQMQNLTQEHNVSVCAQSGTTNHGISQNLKEKKFDTTPISVQEL